MSAIFTWSWSECYIYTSCNSSKAINITQGMNCEALVATVKYFEKKYLVDFHK